MLRNEIWKQLVHAETLLRYYYDLSQHYDKLERVNRGIILFFYVVGASTLLDVMPDGAFLSWVRAVIALCLIVATVWDMTMRYGEKAALLRVICSRCDRSLDQWRELWVESEEEVIENEKLWIKYRYLRDEQTASTEWSLLFGIKRDKDLQEEAENEAHTFIEESY